MRDPPSFRVIIQEFHSYNDFIRNPVRSMSNIKRKRYIKLNGSSGIITYPYMCSIPARCHLSSTDSHSKLLREFYLRSISDLQIFLRPRVSEFTAVGSLEGGEEKENTNIRYEASPRDVSSVIHKTMKRIESSHGKSVIDTPVPQI